MTDENRGKLGLVAYTPGDSLTFRLYANYSTHALCTAKLGVVDDL